jgi:arginase
MSNRAFHVFGVPFRTGSFHPGNENDAAAWRHAGLLDRLRATGCVAVDEGDLAIPSYLPHHLVPPVRNWPGPRIVWDLLAERLTPHLREPGRLPLLVGCDCSVVVGTTQAIRSVSDDLHVLYIDGDFDDAAPDPSRCLSAAALAVWLLTNESPFCSSPPLRPSQVTVVGWTTPSSGPERGVGSVSLSDIRGAGPAEAARRILQSVPSAASVLVHLDIDVIADRELPAAYFPHPEGLTIAETADLLRAILPDPRIRLIEISEYATLRDLDRRCVSSLIDLIARAVQ